MQRIYLDLDGVMADFDRGFSDICKKYGFPCDTAFSSEDKWKIVSREFNFFYDLYPCDGALDFFKLLSNLNQEVIVLTACPKTMYERAALQKKHWVKENLCDNITVLPVWGGKNKSLFMHQPNDILIDDWKDNCDAWKEKGGIAIHHTTFGETIQELIKNVY